MELTHDMVHRKRNYTHRLRSIHVLCTQCNHAPIYIVTSYKITYLVHVSVFSCNLPPELLAE